MMTMAYEAAAREGASQPETPFTLVVSDVHAFPEFLENALRRSGFRAGVDHLVFAGDLLDRGGEPGACLERLEELEAEMLIGDHDHATMLGYFIGEQSPASRDYRHSLLRRFGNGGLNLVAHAHRRAGQPRRAVTRVRRRLRVCRARPGTLGGASQRGVPP